MTYARSWDESLHPRVPAGKSGGGEFGAGGQTAQEKLAGMKEPGSGHHGSSAKTNPWRNGVMAYDPHRNFGPGYDWPGGNPDVKTLQQALNRLGLTDSKGRKLAVDGKLGPLTTQSIKAAQKAFGLKQDGQVTPDLLKQLTAAKNLPAKSATHKARSADPMQPMDTGPSDSQLESHLEDLLAGLSDDDINELAALAEAMHADGGM